MLGFLLCLVTLIVSIVGTRLANNPTVMCSMVLVILSAWYILLREKREKWHKWDLFILSLSVLYQVTLFSDYLIGTDLHLEYYYFQRGLEGWNVNLAHPFNGSVLTSFILPSISRLTHISGYFLFKALIPVGLAYMVTILYRIFRKHFNERDSFISCLFFIMVPSFFIEVPTVIKTAGALVTMAAIYWLLLSNVRKKYLLIGLLVFLTISFHYTQGGVIGLYLTMCIVFIPLVSWLLKKKTNFSIPKMSAVLLVNIVLGGIFVAVVAQGVVFVNIATVFFGTPSYYLGNPYPRIDPTYQEAAQWGVRMLDYTPPTLDSYIKIHQGIYTPPPRVAPEEAYIPVTSSDIRIEPLYKIALGLDFPEATAQGKAFRILQLLTQLLIVLGALRVLIHRKEYSIEYLSLCLAGGATLVGVIFLQGYFAVINSTLWYLMALMVCAPLEVEGSKLLLRKNYVLPLMALLSIYFLFTSGMVYEWVKSEAVKSIDIPYSVTLSSYRLDLGSVATKNDMDVVDYATSRKLQPLISDFYGQFDYEEDYGKDYSCGVLGLAPYKAFPDCYIFIRELNTQRQMLTYPRGVGLRQSFSYDHVQFQRVLDNSEIIYQQGDAMIIKYNGEGK